MVPSARREVKMRRGEVETVSRDEDERTRGGWDQRWGMSSRVRSKNEGMGIRDVKIER